MSSFYQVAVDRFWSADYLYASVVCSKVFGKNGCVGVGVIAADDYDGVDAVLFRYFCSNRELFFCFKFCTAGTDDIESACVAVSVDIVVIEYNEVIFDQTAWTVFETDQNVVRVTRLSEHRRDR